MNIAGIARLSPIVGKLALSARKMSPELLLAAGVVGFVATNVLSSRATLKLEKELEETAKEIEDLSEAVALVEEANPKLAMKGTYTNRDYKFDLTRIYIRRGFNVARLYAPSFIVGGLSLGAIIGSHVVLKNRNIALMAAYQGLSSAYTNYRDAVKKDLGEEADKKYAFGLAPKEVEEHTSDGKSKKTTIITSTDPNKHSPYARWYDEQSAQWHRDAAYNLTYLRAQQSFFNDRLHQKGHVFLNEVYDALGFDRTKEGAVVGWVTNGGGDNFIDFGIYDMYNPSKRAFVNGNEKSILLDFNVDGVIYDKI